MARRPARESFDLADPVRKVPQRVAAVVEIPAEEMRIAALLREPEPEPGDEEPTPGPAPISRSKKKSKTKGKQ